MKIVFLDVDGVLVHQASLASVRERTTEPWGSSFYHAATICPSAMAEVKRVLDVTGARVVISSVWRNHESQVSGLKRALLAVGYERQFLRDLFVGRTPNLGEDRAAEIQAWLDAHIDVTRYLVVDDGEVGAHPQLDPRPSFWMGGFLARHADQAITLLEAP